MVEKMLEAPSGEQENMRDYLPIEIATVFIQLLNF